MPPVTCSALVSPSVVKKAKLARSCSRIGSCGTMLMAFLPEVRPSLFFSITGHTFTQASQLVQSSTATCNE